jgi:hypothetical protein
VQKNVKGMQPHHTPHSVVMFVERAPSATPPSRSALSVFLVLLSWLFLRLKMRGKGLFFDQLLDLSYRIWYNSCHTR